MSESQKETFRKYLEQSGVIEVLVKVLVSLYEEPDKPKAAIDYIKGVLGSPTPAEYDSLLQQKEALEKQLEEHKSIIAQLEAKIAQLESA